MRTYRQHRTLMSIKKKTEMNLIREGALEFFLANDVRYKDDETVQKWLRGKAAEALNSTKEKQENDEIIQKWLRAKEVEALNSTKEKQENEAERFSFYLLRRLNHAFTHLNKVRLDASPKPEEIQEPSKNLLFLVGLFYSAKEREIALGDIEERFKKESEKFGRRKAHVLIARDLLVDIYPITKTALVKLFKWATFYAILKRIIS